MKVIKIAERIYAGAKPSYKTLKHLKKEGVTDIYDLRANKSILALAKFREHLYCKYLGLQYTKKPLDFTKGFPKKDFFISVSQEVENKKVYFHCTNGKHRAGFVSHAVALLSGKKVIETSIIELVENDFFNFKKSKKLRFKEFLNPQHKRKLSENLYTSLETFKKMFSNQTEIT